MKTAPSGEARTPQTTAAVWITFDVMYEAPNDRTIVSAPKNDAATQSRIHASLAAGPAKQRPHKKGAPQASWNRTATRHFSACTPYCENCYLPRYSFIFWTTKLRDDRLDSHIYIENDLIGFSSCRAVTTNRRKLRLYMRRKRNKIRTKSFAICMHANEEKSVFTGRLFLIFTPSSVKTGKWT